MKTMRGVKLSASEKIALISLWALSLSAWNVVSLYHTMPLSAGRVSTSPQKGAMSWLSRGKASGENADTGTPKEMRPLLLTWKKRWKQCVSQGFIQKFVQESTFSNFIIRYCLTSMKYEIFPLHPPPLPPLSIRSCFTTFFSSRQSTKTELCSPKLVNLPVL